MQLCEVHLPPWRLLSDVGPGAIHLLNGLYDAKADQTPALAITGLQSSDVIGTHIQQDFDTVRLIGEVAPYSGTVMQPAHNENMTNLAVRYALANRGVSHIGIPIDVQEASASSGRWTFENQPPSHLRRLGSAARCAERARPAPSR